ncbi:hypothetical protein Vlu01_46240 [Micromonospora lutea]|uniref:Uncharacterized protein n=1 Tax=Micromonospora lutea TaxID=419825 RepID=A0ABQ4J1G9_9ACTN|nr:hypothetical protein Vlu01_46240 [Micromonospora lutea]
MGKHADRGMSVHSIMQSTSVSQVPAGLGLSVLDESGALGQEGRLGPVCAAETDAASRGETSAPGTDVPWLGGRRFVTWPVIGLTSIRSWSRS